MTISSSGDTTAKQSEQTSTTKKEVLHPEESITSFLLIRHGHTKATEEGRLYTDPSAEMTNEGFRQAHAISHWVRDHRPDCLLSSTAKRVITTAEVIGKELNMPVRKIDHLNEWDVGEWEGRTYLDIKKNNPEMYKSWSQDPIMNRPPGGESVADMVERVKERIQFLISEYDGKTVALVTHAGIVRAVLIHALGMPVHNFWRISVPVGTISRVDFSASFATVHYISVQPDLPSLSAH